MPSFVNVDGVVTRRPGVINSVDFSANAGRQENIKRLAVVGNFPYLEPDEPVLVTSQNSMIKLAPQDAEMKRLAKLIYRPGNDSRIANGPSEVWLVSAATSTQASATVDGWGANATTVHADSDGDALPQAIINVQSAAAFAGSGTITVESSTGRQTITYTGKTGTSFTGCSGGTGTLSTGAIVREVTADTLTMRSRAWGYAGNRTRVTLTIDANGVYTFSVSRDGRVERFDNITAETLFKLDYTGARWTTVTGGFNGTDFYAVATKTGQAIGTFTADSSWDGVVTIDPNTAPVGGTYTATITGINTDGEAATCVMTWADGGGHAAISSNSTDTAKVNTPVLFSSITTIVFALTGTADAGGLFTVSGDIYRVTKEEYPFVGQLVAFLQGLTLGSPDEFTVSSVGALVGGVRFEDMDHVASSDLTANISFTNLMTKLVAKLNTSGLIEVEYVANGGAPAPFSMYLKAGTPASQTSPNSGDWAVALAALRNLQPNPPTVISLLTDDATAQTDLAAHCSYMWGAGKYEVQAWTGCAPDATKATIKERTLALNDYRVSYVAQEAYITRVDGVQEWVAPYWYALAHASAHASVGIAVPLTWKRLSVSDVRNGTSWDVEEDVEEMLAAGVTLTTKGPQGLRIERALTTHLSDDDAARTAPSAVESIANYLRRVRARLEVLIGDPARATTRERIISVVISESRQAQRDGVIAAFDENSITAEQIGGVFVVGASIAPVYEITHVNFIATIIPVTLNLAA